MSEGRLLYAVVCGAGPAVAVSTLVERAQAAGWGVQLLATEAARDYFLDIPSLERQTGRPVRVDHRTRGAERMPRADAAVVAPATYNTINKWAAGIADTYPLTVLAELTGAGIPLAVLPFVNSALAGNRVFDLSVAGLRSDGVTVLYGPGAFEPHAPGTGETKTKTFPWQLALDAIHQRMVGNRRSGSSGLP